MSPTMANSTSSTKMIKPAMAALCRKNLRVITCHCLRGLAMSIPAAAA
jgi:hypothetical protein